MKCVRFLISLAVVLNLNVFSAQLKPMAKDKEQPKVWQQESKKGNISNGFQLSMRTEKDSIGTGDIFILKLELKNVSRQIRSIKDQATWYDYEVDLRDEYGEKVAFTEKGNELEVARKQWQEISARFWKVEPGNSLTYSLDITGLYKLKPQETYFITARRKVQKSSNRGWGEIVSNTVKVKIIDGTQQ